MNQSREAEIRYLARRVVSRTQLEDLVVMKVLRALDRDQRLSLVNDGSVFEEAPVEHHFESPVDPELDKAPQHRFGPETMQGKLLKVFYEAETRITAKEACLAVGSERSHRAVSRLKAMGLLADDGYRYDPETSTRSLLVYITSRGRATYEESKA